MPELSRDGRTLHVQAQGSGDPVLLLHGYLVGSMATWYFTAAPLLARTRRAITYDLRGHGRSSRPALHYRVADHLEDLHAVREWAEAETADLVGHSFGGLIALHEALERPASVRRLVLVETPLPPTSMTGIDEFLSLSPQEMLQSLPGALEAEVRAGGRRAKRFYESITRLVGHTSLIDDLRAETDVPDERLASLSLPTLLIYAHESPCLSTGERLAEVLPDARLLTLEGGHYLPVESPVELARTIADFLDG